MGVLMPVKKEGKNILGIQALILQDLYVLLKPYLSVTFNKCIDLRYLPKQWRRAVVKPLPRPNRSDYTLASSYRPLSLLSTVG